MIAFRAQKEAARHPVLMGMDIKLDYAKTFSATIVHLQMDGEQKNAAAKVVKSHRIKFGSAPIVMNSTATLGTPGVASIHTACPHCGSVHHATQKVRTLTKNIVVLTENTRFVSMMMRFIASRAT
jgi:hypothetical protein